jgi:ABC-type xylose transport system permease subunit
MNQQGPAVGGHGGAPHSNSPPQAGKETLTMSSELLLTLTGSETTLLIGAVIGLLLGALFGFLIGRAKARPVAGLFLGGTLAVPGLIAISLMSKKEPDFY